jgi:uncharacterized protein
VDLEKKMMVAAPIDRVWKLLLDPKVMAGCVPGVQSVQVLSDRDYLAEIKVKISFISANFKIKTTILETRPPHYLRCEGTGEDSSVASSLRHTSEIFLTEQPGDQTELLVKAKAEVFGRLGSFGLTVMKTKADRMWEEFGASLAALLRQGGDVAAQDVSVPLMRAAVTQAVVGPSSAALAENGTRLTAGTKSTKSKWWQRLVGTPQPDDSAGGLRLPSDIYVEFHRADTVIKILWPAGAQAEAVTWLKSLTEKSP